MPDSSAGEPTTFYQQLAALEATRTAFVVVILVEALGSTPQNTGAKMLVTPGGIVAGTVGGGRVEAKAIALAQELLTPTTAERASPHFVSWTLKTDVGMTCGGSVKLYFEPHPASGASWSIAIFGAGHITQALLSVILPLPCAVSVFDSRSEWLARLPRSWNLRSERVEDLAGVVDQLPVGTFLLSMTQGHTTDRPILARALKANRFPYIGCIGSASKAAILRQELLAEGMEIGQISPLHCPVGLEFGTNHPHEIALSIAAQLVQERDRVQATS